MAYTNVNIPNAFSNENNLREKCAKLEFELSYANKMKDYYLDILENIPKAVEEYGYVDISFDGKKMKLVKQDDLATIPQMEVL